MASEALSQFGFEGLINPVGQHFSPKGPESQREKEYEL